MKLACVRRPPLGRFVDSDRLAQSPGAIVKVPEPHRRLQVIGVQSEGALEASLRHLILPQHERGNARTKAKARVRRAQRRCPGERAERVTEPLLHESCRASAREHGRILRGADVGGGDGRREHQDSRCDRQSDWQSDFWLCKKNTREMRGKSVVFCFRPSLLSFSASTKVALMEDTALGALEGASSRSRLRPRVSGPSIPERSDARAGATRRASRDHRCLRDRARLRPP